MKNLAILLFFMGNIYSLKAQIAYHDALKLKNLITSLPNIPDDDRVYQILELYVKKNNPSPDDIISEFSGNPFINFDHLLGQSQSSSINSITPIINSISGLNVTSAADALTQHIISNAKEELNIAFFRRFKDFSEKNPEFRTLFPESARVLEDLLEYQYNNMLSVLQDAFIQDANKLIYQLDDLLELPRLKPVRDKFPELLIVIDVLKIADKLEKDINPADILMQLDTMKAWDDNWSKYHSSTKQFYQVLALSNIISSSIRSTDGTKTWIKKEDFQNLIKDETTRQIFLGLIYQQIKNAKKDTSCQILEKVLNSLVAAKKDVVLNGLYNGFISLSTEIDIALKVSQKLREEGKKPSQEQIYNYIDLTLKTVKYGIEVADYSGADIGEEIDQYTDLLTDLNNTYRSLYQKNYTVSLHYAVGILNSAISLASVPEGTKTKDLEELIKHANYSKYDVKKLKEEAQAVNISTYDHTEPSEIVNQANLKKSLVDNKDLEEISNLLSKGSNYFIFISQLADASSAEEAKAAIEAVALPAGSSSLKKHQVFNVNIASYVGAGLRLGEIDEINRSWDKRWFVTMPVGIGFNWGLGQKGNGGSISANLNVFDLGAIAAFRLEEDTLGNKSLDEKIVLGNILSPGIMLNYGFPYDLPLSLGVGCQWGPGLRSIDESDGATFNNIYGTDLRWVVTLAVDVPLLNIYNGQSKGRKK